ncbi:RNA polymerase sigma factor [Gluconacetobacter sp. Hr-1-5]|uniref:RNA polymerase sigma factor n=1 Tax=Gluconacetobacter sp. Hr-1-5 TaxID=3395370 RepID=UPI003B51F08D
MCQETWQSLSRRVRAATRRDDADDHLQAALLNYIERPEGSIQHPEAYIVRSAVNLAHNERRREQGAPAESVDWTVLDSQAGDVAPLQDQIVEARERMARFQEGCARLPGRMRQVFVLNRVEKMPYRRIAAALGISESTVEKEMAKALVFLQSWMEH